MRLAEFRLYTYQLRYARPVRWSDIVEEAASFLRPVLALYIGGMGAKDMNFHANVFSRMGYEAESKVIQELYLAGRKDEAAAAVPMSLIEETSLIGPKEKIRDDLEAWRESCVTQLQIYGDANTLRTMAELCL